MMNLKRFGKAVGLTAVAASVALGSAGCNASQGASPEADEMRTLTSQWIPTEQGELRCVLNRTRMGYHVTDCDWSTLTPLGTHTDKNAQVMDGEFLKVNGKEYYCLISRTSYGYEVTDCNWNPAE